MEASRLLTASWYSSMWKLIGVIKQGMSKVLLKSIPEVISCGTNPVTPTGCDSSGKSKLSLHHGIWEQWLYRTKSQDFVVDLSLSHMHLWCFQHLLGHGSLHSAEEATFFVLDPRHFFLQKGLPCLVYLRAFSFAAYYNSPWEAVSDYPSFHPSLWPVLLLKRNVILPSSAWIE